ncbi:hypothetical protein, partial [Providencia rettgeri]
MNIFFANSALQILLLDLILIEESINNGLLILKKNKNDMNQFNLCIEKLKKNRSIKVIKLPDNIIAFYLLSFITIFFKKIILGDIKSVYYQLSIRFVNKRKVIFYDDGFSSILVLKLLKENKSISILNGMQNASFLKKII